MRKALTLKYEAQQQSALTASLQRTLAAAALCPSMDAAQAMLENTCTAGFWRVTRGGSHVALNSSVNATGGWHRVAMICEATTAYEVFHYNACRSEMRRIEERARGRDSFLRDAPAGSANLREAMLEEAIYNIASQRPAYIVGQPVMTTGQACAVDAAVAIAEGVADFAEAS